MTIILITMGVGMLFFQFLVSWEAYRNFVRNLKRELTGINWAAMPKVERSFQQSRPGVMSLKNNPKALRKAWQEMFK